MDFEEKIDAMRMTLELAMHDIEAERGRIQELRMLSESQRESIHILATASEALLKNAERQEIASASQRESIQVLATASEAFLKNAERQEITSANQRESIQVLATASEAFLKNAGRQEEDLRALKKITADLVTIANSHDRRIGAIEGRA